MNYTEQIMGARPTFICDDKIQDVIKGGSLPNNNKEMEEIIYSLRNNQDLELQELLRTLHIYNFANPQRNGIIIDLEKIKQNIDNPDFKLILSRDFFVTIISQIYITLHASTCASAIRKDSTQNFYHDLNIMRINLDTLKTIYNNIISNSNNLNLKNINTILNSSIEYNNKKYTIINFSNEIKNDENAFLNSNSRLNVQVFNSIQNISKRSVENERL